MCWLLRSNVDGDDEVTAGDSVSIWILFPFVFSFVLYFVFFLRKALQNSSF